MANPRINNRAITTFPRIALRYIVYVHNLLKTYEMLLLSTVSTSLNMCTISTKITLNQASVCQRGKFCKKSQI